MPLSDLQKASVAGGVTQAGSSILGGIFGMIGQRKQRKYEREMYERQLAENRKNWELENIYNSPAQQMERLKQAGLNPNLVYGNGATALGGNISSADPKVSDQSDKLLPFAGIANSPMSAINTLYDLRMKDAQTDLLIQKEQTERQNTILTTARGVMTDLMSDKLKIENLIGRKTWRTLVDQVALAYRQGLADLSNTRADTHLKNVSANLGGSRKTGQDISNQQEQMSLDLYKSLGLPPQLIDQLLKTAPFLTPFINKFKSRK